MATVGSLFRPDRKARLPKTPLAWCVTYLLGLPVAVLFMGALANLAEGAVYSWYLASEATVFDAWGALRIISTVLSLIAVVGTGLAAWRLRMVAALLFAALPLPATFVIEGSRCDTPGACQVMGWAALPPSAFGWQVRIRPVTDRNEAERIASGLLSRANLEDGPFQAKRFGDHWIVSTIDADGWPGAHAVRIDTRTAQTALVPCPQDSIQCGMERPTVSDGQRVYRNAQLGLSAVFPASRPVCTARDDDGEPRGFYAIVRAPDMPCEVIDQSRQMGIEVIQSRRDDCALAEAQSMPWHPLSADTSKLFESQTRSLGGLPSLTCELRDGDQIQISVYAPTGLGSDPGATFEAYIVTTPSYLVEDIRAFETFLETARIGSTARKTTD